MNVKTLARNIADLDDVQKLRLVGAVNEQNNDLYAYMNVVPFDDEGLELLLNGKSIPEIVRMSVFAYGSNGRVPFNYADEYICIGEDGNLQSVSESYIQRQVDGEDEWELAENVFSVLGADVDEDIDVGNLLSRYLDLDSDIIEKLARTTSVEGSRKANRLTRTAEVNYSHVANAVDNLELNEYMALQRFLVQLGFDQFDHLTFEPMSALNGYCENMQPHDVLKTFKDNGHNASGGVFNPYLPWFTFYGGKFTSYTDMTALDALQYDTAKFARALVDLDHGEVESMPVELAAIKALLE